MRSRGLYPKILVTFITVIVTAAAAGGAALLLGFSPGVTTLRQETLLAFGRLVARDVHDALASGDTPEQALAKVAARYHEFPPMHYLLIDSTGALHGTVSEKALPPLDAATLTGLAGGTPPPASGVVTAYPGSVRGFVCQAPVASPGGPATLVVAGRAPLDSTEPALVETLAGAALVVFLVTALIGSLAFRRLAARLGELRDSLAAVSRGDRAHRVTPSGDDEITDLARSFNHMVDRVADLEEQRRRFLADISHELKTPLTSLKGNLEQIVEGSAAGSRAANVAFEEVERLAMLVEDLLGLARMEAATFDLKQDEEILQRTVSRCAERLAVACRNRGITLIRRLPEEPVRRRVDARRLEQAISNVMDNGVKALEEGGTLTVAVEVEDGRARIVVEDDGPGVPEADQAAVFDRFFTTARPGGGTGLGLSIVKRIVEAHGGRVALGTRPGGGTRVTLELDPAPGAEGRREHAGPARPGVLP